MSDLNIYQRMHAVMKAVGYIQKEDKKVNNQYTFVSHDAVTAKIRPALIENGIIAVPQVVNWKQDGNRTECDLHMNFVNIDKPDERITVAMFGFGIDPMDKGPGKAISYAVKYALLKAFSLETGDDPEKDQIEHKPAPQKAFAAPHTPTDGAIESLSLDEQTVVFDLSNRVRKMGIKDVKGCCDEVDETLKEFDNANDMKTALWAHLKDLSTLRNAMKAEWKERREATVAA